MQVILLSINTHPCEDGYPVSYFLLVDFLGQNIVRRERKVGAQCFFTADRSQKAKRLDKFDLR